MKNGAYCYQIELIAPLGLRNGEMEICLTENEISGTFFILGNTSPFAHGLYKTGTITVAGKLKTLMYELPYELIGEMDEEGIRFGMETSRGVFFVSGTRTCGRSKAALSQQKTPFYEKAGKSKNGIYKKD